MKQILIPVDFGPGSYNSCKYAIEITTKSEPVTLWLFHVYADQILYMPSSDPDGMMADPALSVEFSEEIKKIAEANMTRLKNEVLAYINKQNYTNFTINDFMISGDPDWIVQDVCDDLNPDGIIMSNEGTGNKSPLEGSMAMRIMGKATVPVIAVPYQYNNYQFKNVLYATKLDDEPRDIKAIKTLLKLFKHHGLTIYVVHFRKSDTSNVSMHVLENAFEKERLAEKVRFMIVNDDNQTESTIKAVTIKNEIDMIAFVAHKTHPLKLLFSRGIHKDDFLSTGLPVFGLPPQQD
jgi:nucleotide-binding universal stress UspA family protein